MSQVTGNKSLPSYRPGALLLAVLGGALVAAFVQQPLGLGAWCGLLFGVFSTLSPQSMPPGVRCIRLATLFEFMLVAALVAWLYRIE